MGAKNATKVKNKLYFDKIENTKTIKYQHKVNIGVTRLDNVDTVSFVIDGVPYQEGLMVNPGQTVNVVIVKVVLGKEASLTLEEIFSGKKIVLWFFPKASTPG